MKVKKDTANNHTRKTDVIGLFRDVCSHFSHFYKKWNKKEEKLNLATEVLMFSYNNTCFNMIF